MTRRIARGLVSDQSSGSLKTRPLSLLALLPALACSSASQEQLAASSSALVSPTTTYLLPVEDDVRVACHSTWTNAWCQASDAHAAGDSCVAAFVASGVHPACAGDPAGCFELLTEPTPCAADGPIYPTPASCASPVPRTCAFYAACLETSDPCGASGYALGYGEKYCSRYDVDDTLSPEGLVWRNAVLHCLQTALVPLLASDPPMSCDAVTTYAFDSHPTCYTAGPSICFLPPSDVLNIVSVIDGKDLLSLRSAKQIATVAAVCIEQLGGALADLDVQSPPEGLSEAGRDRSALGERLRFWKDLQAARLE
jgi:hypothetical protein